MASNIDDTNPQANASDEPQAADFDFEFQRIQNESESSRSRSSTTQSRVHRIGSLMGCIGLLVGSGMLGVWLPVLAYRDPSPRDAGGNFVVWVILPMFCVLGLSGLWLSLRRIWFLMFGGKTLNLVADPRAPTLSDGSLVCRDHGWLGKPVCIVVDRDAGMIHFHNCHLPRRRVALKAQAWFRCPLSDVRDAYRCRFSHKGFSHHWLTIVTAAGTAHLSSSASNFESLCDALSVLIPGGLRTDFGGQPFAMLSLRLIGNLGETCCGEG